MKLKSFLSWSSAITLHPPPAAAIKNHVHVQAIHLPWLVVADKEIVSTLSEMHLISNIIYQSRFKVPPIAIDRVSLVIICRAPVNFVKNKYIKNHIFYLVLSETNEKLKTGWFNHFVPK
uniref:Uncharacterized protein n=1 Tax=Oryza punctata TaxID=4537 RepID=A0A0E0KSL7_ORYPU